MSTLEDKILGEKNEYYCSSSSEDETDDTTTCSERKVSKWEGVSSNTGPKGVMRDWEIYKDLESKKRSIKARKTKEMIKNATMTCSSALDEEKEALETDPDMLDLLADDYLQEYQKQRMQEMFEKMEKLRFGDVINLKNTDEFLDAIDNEDKFVTVIIHIYERNIPGCDAMNGSLLTLAKEYPFVKFCKILGSSVNVSKHFQKEGVPALLAYKNGHIVGNFVNVSEALGEDFFADDVAAFLTEHGLLNDKRCKPVLISSD